MTKLLAVRQQQIEKRGSKKGFTLVEVIVVLVILAILAAILIPSMIGWINKAEDKSAIIEGRTMVLAAQTIVSENYDSYRNNADKDLETSAPTGTLSHKAQAEALADLTGVTITSCKVKYGKIVNMVITGSGGKTVTYDGTTYTVA